MAKGNARWHLFLIITFLVWGTQHPALKILSGELSPVIVNLARFSLAWIALIPFAAGNGQRAGGKDLIKISFLGFIGPFLFGILNLTGLESTTATNSAILLNTWPLMVVILAPLLIGEKISGKSSLGVVSGFIGVVLVASHGMGIGGLLNHRFLAGNLLILLSALCIAFYSMFSKHQIAKYGGLEVTFRAFAAASALLLALSVITGDIFALAQITLRQFLLILWVAVPTTALTWVIWFRSIEKIGLVETSSFFLLIPVSGMLSSNLFLGEELTIFTVAGSLLIFAGIYAVQRK